MGKSKITIGVTKNIKRGNFLICRMCKKCLLNIFYRRNFPIWSATLFFITAIPSLYTVFQYYTNVLKLVYIWPFFHKPYGFEAKLRQSLKQR